MSTATQNAILDAATLNGWVEIQSGVYLNSLANILAEQDAWPEGDEGKDIDFSNAPFWLTTDSGNLPTPVRDASDLPAEVAA